MVGDLFGPDSGETDGEDDGGPRGPSGPGSDDVLGAVRIAPLRRRHLGPVVRIEEDAYPRPWSSTLFLSEIAQRSSRGVHGRHHRADRRRLLRAHGGGGGRATSPRSPSTRHGTAAASGRVLLLDQARAAPRFGVRHLTLEVREGEHRGPGAVPALRLRSGRGPAATTTPRRERTPSSCGRATSTPPSYARAAGGIESQLGSAPMDRAPAASCSASRPRATRPRRPWWAGAARCGRRWCRARWTCTPATAGSSPSWPGRAHLELLTPVVCAAPSKRRGSGCGPRGPGLDAVAATTGPGLIGSLLVGRERGQGAGPGVGRPVRRRQPPGGPPLRRPARPPRASSGPSWSLLVSGGHTLLVSMEGPGRYRLLGQTLDDAAGRGVRQGGPVPRPRLPRGPGHREGAAASGDPAAFAFPRAMLGEGLDFSFSGLKTAVVHAVRRHPDASDEDVAASFQQAVVDVLVAKTLRARRSGGRPGGVPGRGGGGQRAPAGRPGRRLRRSSGCPPTCPAWPCAPTTRP